MSYTPPLEGKEPSLFRKIAEIQGAVGGIEPDEKMQVAGRGDYRYISEKLLLERIRPLLATSNVAAFVSVDTQSQELMEVIKSNGKPGAVTHATVTMSITFADGDSGEMFMVLGQGQAQDFGDKAIYKAITSANRYMWWKAMLVGTGEDAAGTPSQEFTLQRSGGATAEEAPSVPAPAENTNGSGPYISTGEKSQQQVLWITAKEHKVSAERVRELVDEICGLEAATHTERILRKDFQAVLDAIKMDGVPFG